MDFERDKKDDDGGKVKGSSGGVSGFAGRQAKATRKEKIWWSPATYSVFVASEYIWARQNQIKKIIIFLSFQLKKQKIKIGFKAFLDPDSLILMLIAPL